MNDTCHLGICRSRARRMQRLPLLITLCALLGTLLPIAAHAQSTLDTAASGAEVVQAVAPDWLEPRGLSVVDLVGLVPESHLVDTIISSRVGLGIVQYVSGSRSGDTVTVNVRFRHRYWTDGSSWATLFGCLGKPAIADEWPVAVPPASMRVYENGTDITAEVNPNFDYVPAGQNHPGSNASGWWRYDYRWGQRTQFNEDGSVAVPANMGCGYGISRRIENLTATFVFTSPSYLTVEELGSQSFTFHSYVGAGNSGHLSSLNEQMNRRFGNRHDKFDLTLPENADYALVKFPPTPVDPYMGQPEINVFLAGSGTYRLNGADNTLSVDHVNSMALPLYGQWQDADQRGGDFLRHFTNTRRLASPEYFVPTDIPYDPCMTNGGCSNDLLDRIHNAEMTMTVYYYRIARVSQGLEKISLRQVGPDWSTVVAADWSIPTPSTVTAQIASGPIPAVSDAVLTATATNPVATPATPADAAATVTTSAQPDQLIYLPLIHSSPPPPTELPDGDASNCPCGWFDGYGRMFDFVAGQ